MLTWHSSICLPGSWIMNTESLVMALLLLLSLSEQINKLNVNLVSGNMELDGLKVTSWWERSWNSWRFIAVQFILLTFRPPSTFLIDAPEVIVLHLVSSRQIFVPYCIQPANQVEVFPDKPFIVFWATTVVDLITVQALYLLLPH